MFCVQLILAMAFVGVGRQTPFQHSLQSAAANHGACGQPRRAHATGDCG